MKGIPPPCEGCLPIISESNIEAWEVYQLACLDSMGISPEGVIAICKVMEIDDIKEALYKVSELVRTIRGLQEEQRKQKET